MGSCLFTDSLCPGQPAFFASIAEHRAWISDTVQMWWHTPNSSKYAALKSDCDGAVAEEAKSEGFPSCIHGPQHRRRGLLLKIAPWFGHSIFLMISFAILLRASQLYHESQNGPPFTHELGAYYTRTTCTYVVL